MLLVANRAEGAGLGALLIQEPTPAPAGAEITSFTLRRPERDRGACWRLLLGALAPTST
jgi:hypothetical protein